MLRRSRSLLRACSPALAQAAMAEPFAPAASLVALRLFHASGMSATTVLCVRKDNQACYRRVAVAPSPPHAARDRLLSKVVMIGDGQVTMGSEVVKPNVKKVRRIGTGVIGGFAGATADAFTLFERLETKLEEHPVRRRSLSGREASVRLRRADAVTLSTQGQLTRACVELAKNWRMDKYLRRLDVRTRRATRLRASHPRWRVLRLSWLSATRAARCR